MISIKNHWRLLPLSVISILLSSLLLCACGGFGGRYLIESAKTIDEGAAGKYPLRVRLILSPALCSYTYTYVRQGAKRFYEIGDAMCDNHRNLFHTLFEKVVVVSDENEGCDSDYDVTATPQIVDTSVLVRPGAPPNFEATIIYECALVDKDQRTIFLRTVKEDKVHRGYGHKGYGIVMQQAVDELFVQLRHEIAISPEIRRLAGLRK